MKTRPPRPFPSNEGSILKEGKIISTNRHASPIADEVAELHNRMSEQPPSDLMAVFTADQHRLQAVGIPAGVARPPSPFPDTDLVDADGNIVSTRTVLAGRTTVVVFYRGAWCPYCNIALRAYQLLLPELDGRGASLVAISPQKPDGPAGEADASPFRVLCDPGSTLASALGIVMTPGDRVLSAQAQLGLDLRAVNADGGTAIPMPTVALVDASGVLRWIDVHPDYTTRTEPEQILAALDTTLPD